MSRTSIPQRAFNAGEMAPLLSARTDYQRAQSGLQVSNGFLPLVEGGATRAPGTLFRGVTAGNQKARLISFEFALNDALTLEFTDFKMRVWRYGTLVQSGGSPFELVTPYGADVLDQLQAVQSADRIYIADGAQPIQRLSRFALDHWTIEATPFEDGPFRAINDDDSLTLQASADTGTITLTASAGVFEAAHVGSLFRLEAEEYPDTPVWTGNTDVSVGDRMRNDGNIYEIVSGTNTKVNAPIHSAGSEKLSDNGPVWEFISDGSGIVRITAVASATEATAEVIQRLPNEVVSVATPIWAEGAWNDKNGYPACIELDRGRFIAAATPTEPRTIWFSTSQAFLNFKPGTLDDESFALPVPGSKSLNRVLWLRGGKQGLYVGSLGQEFIARSLDPNRGLAATTISIDSTSEIGSSAVVPIAPDGRPIFVAKDGRRLHEMTYDFSEDALNSTNLSRTASHIGAEFFRELAWQDSPFRIAWMRRADGTLAMMVHDPQEQVLGWAPFSLAGGEVQSLAVTPSASADRDVVMVCIKRSLGDQDVYAIEELADIYDQLIGVSTSESAVHLYAALEVTSDTPTKAWSVPHLAGETVEAWGDTGALEPAIVQSDGTVTFSISAQKLVIGLFDNTHRMRTLDVVAGSPSGDTMGRRKRIERLAVHLHNTADGFVRVVERDEDEDKELEQEPIIRSDVAADRNQGSSYIRRLDQISGSTFQVYAEFTPRGGAPMTILGINATQSEAGY